MNYLVKVSTNQLLEIQIESSKREAQEFSKLISYQIDNGIDRDIIIKNIQKSIEGTSIESGFICMFDWSGIEICHPDPKKIGQQTTPDQSYVRPINDEINPEDFYDLLTKKKEITGGVREFSDNKRASEIIYLYPVANTDWIIAAHANMGKIESHINELKINFLLVYFLTSVVIILLSLISVRFLSNYYENQLESKNQLLQGEVLALSKLNLQLTKYKDKVSSNTENLTNEDETDKSNSANFKRRVLTYSKNKLLSVKVDQISFIYTENTITYITNLDGEIFTTNSSLDELYSSLDDSIFFRANRQYIISVKGIEEILKYGNNQLKIITKHSEPIIISKNKASEFKKWLNR